MSNNLEIRASVESDAAEIGSLYSQAFPDEYLQPLVQDLLQDLTITVSLVGLLDSRVAGHVIFTRCGVVGSSVKASLLGPLAVDPNRQRQGIGSSLVRAGLQQLKDEGVDLVCVLGDPRYYGRFGFVQEGRIEPPFPLPPAWSGAWQAKYLDDTMAPCTGRLAVPVQWQQPDLWAP